MGNIADKIENNKNLISNLSQPLAVIGLEKSGLTMAGKLLAPAVWAVNYTVNYKTPDKVDVSIYSTGLFGGAVGPAAIVTSIVKAVVDDDMNQRLKVVRNSEKPEYRKGILPAYHFSSSPPGINAQKIASMGGTAWQHPNGLWVYIKDKNGLLVPNFKPAKASTVYKPVWPLQSMGGGKFRFTGRN